MQEKSALRVAPHGCLDTRKRRAQSARHQGRFRGKLGGGHLPRLRGPRGVCIRTADAVPGVDPRWRGRRDGRVPLHPTVPEEDDRMVRTLLIIINRVILAGRA